MPGITGFGGPFGGEVASGRLLERMAEALEPDDRFRRELYSEPGLGIGRVTLGIVNPDPQPLWNADETVCLVMEGELYDTDPLKALLRRRGVVLRADNDAELLLHLYQTFGREFAVRVNGAFIAAIWDKGRRRLLIVGDRLGLQPLYYAEHRGGLLFASGVRALLADDSLSRTVDPVGVAQFLTFDHLLHDRTLLQNVGLLPGGSMLTFEEGRVDVQSYWEPRHPRAYPLCDEQAWMEELLHRLRQAMERQAPAGLPAGMLLSGGLDSRVLLALLREKSLERPFHTFTWGIPGCDDARFGAEVAKKVGVEHHFFELKPDWLLDFAEECVRITDGMGNLVNLHARATLDEEVKHARVLYKGFLGDAMMGFAQRHQHWADYDEPEATEAHLNVHRAQGVITFDPKTHQELFTESFLQQVGTAVMDSYRTGMANSGSTLLADQRIYFDYRQRVPRHTLNGVQVVRSRAAVRLPFADNDLVEMMLRVPPGLRYERRLMRNTFIQAFPDLAKIPMPDTGLPMIDCARDILIRTQRLIRWHLKEAGFKSIDYLGRRPYKDYNTWFRTVLREWVEDTLLDRRSLERGYVKADHVRRLVEEHMAGKDHTIKLGALLSLELWHRRTID